MPSQSGRDFLLKIGDGGTPEVFTTLGAARLVEMSLDNQLADATSMDGDGFHAVNGAAGVQVLQIALEGLFKDAAAEEALRLSAFSRTAKNYKLVFPNGDSYTAAFVVGSYQRSGSVEGLEGFAATLVRTGAGVFA